MEVQGRNIVTYSVLKVVKTFLIEQIKPFQLGGKVMDYVFNEYP